MSMSFSASTNEGPEFSGKDLSSTIAAEVIQKVTSPQTKLQSNKRANDNKTISLRDVVGSGTAKPPSEQESETRVLKSVENIDLNEGQPQEDEDTKRLYKDIVSEDVAARASASATVSGGAETVDPEKEPLTTSIRDDVALSNSTSETQQPRSVQATRRSSMEERLFGLTAALAEMKSQEGGSSGSPSSQLVQSGGIKSASADGLAKAADLLVGQANNEINDLAADDIEAQKSAPPEQAVGESPETEGETTSDDEKGRGGRRRLKRGTSGRRLFGRSRGNRRFSGKVASEIEAHYEVFSEFMEERKPSAKRYLKRLFLFVIIPSLGFAALLFYALDNPMTGGGSNPDPNKYASISWWFIFLGVRQPLTLSLAYVTQALVIDYSLLRTRGLMKWIGPLTTLLFVQSRGWPFIATFWGVYNLALLAGPTQISDHWLWWNNAIDLFNATNPAGNITNSYVNFLFIALAMVVGVLVSLKRVFVSLFLGRQTVAHFGEPLADCMKNILLIGSVGTLARTIERENNRGIEGPSIESEDKNVRDLVAAEASALDESENGEVEEKPSAVDAANAFITKRTTVHHSKTNQRDDDFTKSEQLKMVELLDCWEETQTATEKAEKKISIGSVLQFRQALTLLNAKYPFTPAFGIADTREACIESAQEVYERLLLRTPEEDALPFETLALLAKGGSRGFDEEFARDLIAMFRPDRHGKLTKLDFVKSIDQVYRQTRLLSANVSNSRHTDAAVESCFNAVFWFFIIAFVLSELGIDPWAVLLSFSSIIIALSFMFGSSLSKYVEGTLFILLQRPYGVGDRIHLSQPDTDTSIDGSSGWIVEKLSLSTTTLYWGATNERATVSNGALANYRVINSARSPNAQIYINMKFAIDTAFEKIETFRAATVQFLKDRPREWLSFVGFRPTEVAPDRGFINYVTVAQHRHSWQDIGPILSSKADLVKFSLEVAKQLDMRYISPPLPVDLTLIGNKTALNELTPSDIGALSSE